ncbi:hypothetical protein DICSQDRAFT_169632 [Dichomitus squalens LYAD-421 SS1]|uniref:Uncharacterized protein n=1 Tax=Dichomitus squalens (strain LYAD-421) TaxID=732165 RepID=R7T0U6_DICSQ|nr:uncharacterized protein DICSQDRAFT_169632 [Dichomitus squalens LYAD-421 SS1]EJF62054.1 hypothetical protein DICSQDRAFT_169632 [Dichomitus squalens LYAD-421 SS1]
MLYELVEEITGVPYQALSHAKSLDRFSVAQRISWAAMRETTKKEDRAYSLLGIFTLNLPTLYGEEERAFRRLQEEIAWQQQEITGRIPDEVASILPEKRLTVEICFDREAPSVYSLHVDGVVTERPQDTASTLIKSAQAEEPQALGSDDQEDMWDLKTEGEGGGDGDRTSTTDGVRLDKLDSDASVGRAGGRHPEEGRASLESRRGEFDGEAQGEGGAVKISL